MISCVQKRISRPARRRNEEEVREARRQLDAEHREWQAEQKRRERERYEAILQKREEWKKTINVFEPEGKKYDFLENQTTTPPATPTHAQQGIMTPAPVAASTPVSGQQIFTPTPWTAPPPMNMVHSLLRASLQLRLDI